MERDRAVEAAVQRFLELDTAEGNEQSWRTLDRWLEENPECRDAFAAIERDSLLARMLADLDEYPADERSVNPAAISWSTRAWLKLSELLRRA